MSLNDSNDEPREEGSDLGRFCVTAVEKTADDCSNSAALSRRVRFQHFQGELLFASRKKTLITSRTGRKRFCKRAGNKKYTGVAKLAFNRVGGARATDGEHMTKIILQYADIKIDEQDWRKRKAYSFQH